MNVTAVSKVVNDFVHMVEEYINEGKSLCISGEYKVSHFIISVIPDLIKVDKGIYFEGEGLIINISGMYEIEYDEFEEMYIIENEGSKYYFAK
jgi:hypothetical protein